MDRQKALSVLGLPETAGIEDVQKRYEVLFRKFKSIQTDEKGSTWEDIEAAYRFLMGINFHDPEAEKRKKYVKDHPNPILKLFGIDQEKFSNFVHYNKWYFIGGALVVFLVVSFIVSAINRVDPDLKMVCAGELALAQYEPLENAIIEQIEGAQAVQLQVIPLSVEGAESQVEMVSREKLQLEVLVGKNDIFILDLATYRDYAALGAFVALNDRIDELGIKEYDKEMLEVALDAEDGEESGTPMLYGVDVSNSPLLRDYGLLGETFIATMGIAAENPENAEVYFKKLIDSVQ
jgi:hypothetical protein